MSLFRIAGVLAVIGVFMPLFVVAASALSGVGHRWPDVLAQFVAPALAASFVLTLVLVIIGWRRLGLVGAGVSVLLLVAVWPQWATPRAAPEKDAPVIRLYSANLWARNQNVAAIEHSIQRANADIVVLVEVGDAPGAHLDRILAGYPHVVRTERFDRPSGAALSLIASRFPLQWVGPWAPGVSSVAGVAETPIGRMNIIGVHLTRPWPYQYQWSQLNQVQSLSTFRKGLDGPVVMAGDFNSISSARVGRRVQDQMGMIPAGGWPGTWPSALPPMLGVTIDQVWRSRELTFVSRRLGHPTGSDHRPVITEISLAARRSGL